MSRTKKSWNVHQAMDAMQQGDELKIGHDRESIYVECRMKTASAQTFRVYRKGRYSHDEQHSYQAKSAVDNLKAANAPWNRNVTEYNRNKIK